LTSGDDYESLSIRPPYGEYDAYTIYIDHSNVSLEYIDMIGLLDDNNGVRKPPDKIDELTKSIQERHERLIAGKHGDHERLDIGHNSDPEGDIAFMIFNMHRFIGDTYDDDDRDDDEYDDNPIDGNDIDDDVDTLDDEEDEEEEDDEEEEGTKIDENMEHKKRISTPDSREWGTCPNCVGCGYVGNICSKCNEDGMKCRIICGEALVSMVFGKVMMSIPETSHENVLHVMVTASSELDVDHSIDSLLEQFKLCGTTTVFDVVTVYTKLIVLISYMREQGR
jgi:hypothetical protein